MIEFKKGNIFSTQCDVIVNAVNCVGVMGAGIALEFKIRFPEMFKKYKEFCENGSLDIGKLWIYSISKKKFGFSRILIFPTKKDWKKPSKEEFIIEGLEKFIQCYKNKNISSIAFPYLGTGKGGISKEIILRIMNRYLYDLPIKIEIWEFDAFKVDEFFLNFKKTIINSELSELKKLSGVKEDKLTILKDSLVNKPYYSFSELSKIEEITISTLQKLLKCT
ncbi:TPA: macro domain-containing protein [Haemophilus influenzae]|uniref:macro domain-containing protein n=1 Tax=Haemophilus influenzae TaxID=727 RepID=UPI000E340ACB|nr:macro domain-containing protein [Haemophilus influenzae]RFN84700.1 Appr-1-p processing protein [Haemophilus influenzae]